MADYNPSAGAPGMLNGDLISDAYTVANFADSQIDQLLDQVWNAVQSGGSFWWTVNGTPKPIDPQSGAGALIIDRLMSELSNLESISANAVATAQRIQKEINSKLS